MVFKRTEVRKILVFDGMAHDTYYVYDDYGDLVCAVPPLLADHVGGTATYLVKEYQDLSGGQAEFAYDANGNLVRDDDRGITHIRYNLLNLPDSIAFAGGKHLTNLYDASGRKWQTDNTTFLGIEMMPVVVNGTLATRPILLREGSGTLYADGIDYEYEYRYDQNTGKSPLTLTKTRIHNPEGYVTEGDHYYYYRRDHLGNIREVWTPGGWLVEGRGGKLEPQPAHVAQRIRYYPSGLPCYDGSSSPEFQPYKYGGKEYVETHGLDMYDSHARWYYATIMRTTTMDQLAEKYYNISPYAWCGNNPVRNVDPTGMDVWEMDYNGHVYWREESDIHTLYALDAEGQRTGNSITLRNRNVFDNLANSGLNSNYTMTFSKGNPSELAAVFLFAADNSNAEWRFSRYDIGNGDQYAIGTVHDSGLAISPEKMGFPQEAEISFVHSHPTPYPTTTQEKESMGWVSEGKIWNPSDSYNVVKYSQQYKSYHYSYVYFPYTHNIYHVRGGRQPALIRNVLNHQYRPNSLFWGTLNGK